MKVHGSLSMYHNLWMCACLSVLHISCIGQGRNSVWVFQQETGMDFTQSPPRAFESEIGFTGGGGGAISDVDGNLLIYTDGTRIFDRNHDILPDGFLSFGSGFFHHSSAFIPDRFDDNLIHLLYLEDTFTRGIGNLRHAVIDMSLNNGLGDVVSDNRERLVARNIGPGMRTIAGPCGKIWVLVRRPYSREILVYQFLDGEITLHSSFLSSAEVLSAPQLSSFVSSTTYFDYVPSTSLLLMLSESDVIEAFYFDSELGEVTDQQLIENLTIFDYIDRTVDRPNNLAISFSGRYLISGESDFENQQTVFYSYDLDRWQDGTITESKKEFYRSGALWDVARPHFPADELREELTMARRPSSELIYVGSHFSEYLHEVSFDDQTGEFVFTENALPLNGIVAHASDLQRLVVEPMPPVHKEEVIEDDQRVLCPSDITTIIIDPTLFDSVLWQDGSKEMNYMIDVEGTYQVEAYVAGCMRRDSIDISTSQNRLIADIQIPCSEGPGFFNTPGGRDGLWQDGTVSQSYVAAESGSYWVTYQQGSCMVTDTFNLQLSDTEFLEDLPMSVLNCGNLDSAITLPDDNTYLWDDGRTGPSLDVSISGNYTVEVTTACGNSFEQSIEVEFVEELDLVMDTVICGQEELFIDLTREGFSYDWSDGVSGPTRTIAEGGIYEVMALQDAGCIYFDTLEVIVIPDELVITASALFICEDEEVELSVADHDDAMITWSTGEQSSAIRVNTPGTYIATLQEDECIVSDSLFIDEQPFCDCLVYVPNVLSTSSQLGNEQLSISSNCQLSQYEMSIYDRWGGRIFTSSNIEISWDGKLNDADLTPGVYVVSMTYAFAGEDEERKEWRSVTLVP